MGKRRKRNDGKLSYEQISHKLGHDGLVVGRDGELRVFKACKHYKGMPPWWKDIREKTGEEDVKKIDLVVLTDIGEIYIQVKSSITKGTNRSPKRTSNNIPIVYVNLSDSDSEIRKRVIPIVASERRMMFKNKNFTAGR